MIKLFEHQEAALEAINTTDFQLGRIVIPTGGGKTVVEAYALRDYINEDARNLHVVLAPRIALVNQLVKEYRNHIGQNYLAIAFHSGRHEPDYEKVRWAERSTTYPDVIIEEIARAKRMKKDLVIFSTYASAEKLLRFKIDTLIADESQYCVSENYFEVVRAFDATRKLFFTATEKHTSTDSGRGLNNEEVFGEVLYQIAPKTLIERGVIVAPRLHIMNADARDRDYTVIDEVVQLANKQIQLSSHMPVTKILYAMKGTDDVRKVVERVDELKSKIPSDYRIFTIISNQKYGAMVDGVRMARGDFMKELRETDRALIFHYDILSEGIDIDGITGVVLLRNMTHSKLLQTIGRAVRVYKANPSAKKEAWVSVVTINGNNESKHHLAVVVHMIRNGGFEVAIENVVFTDREGRGVYDDDDLDDLVSSRNREDPSQLLENILHEIEVNEYWKNRAEMSTKDIIEAFA